MFPVLTLVKLARAIARDEKGSFDPLRLLARLDAFELDEEPVAVRSGVLDDEGLAVGVK